MAATRGDEEQEAQGGVHKTDPTRLTTQQLIREIDGLRELIEARMDGMDHDRHSMRQIIETRLDGYDKAIRLLQDTADKFPARIDEKIQALQHIQDQRFGLQDEKFRSIQTQFSERDVRTEQTSRDSKVAVDAALQAAKEAVAEQNRSSALSITKSETSTGKQIDQLVALIQSNAKAVDDKFDDLKQRVTRIEGRGEGTAVTHATTQTSNSFVLAIIAALIALAVGATGIIINLNR